jgi:hypothetical protein
MYAQSTSCAHLTPTLTISVFTYATSSAQFAEVFALPVRTLLSVLWLIPSFAANSAIKESKSVVALPTHKFSCWRHRRRVVQSNISAFAVHCVLLEMKIRVTTFATINVKRNMQQSKISYIVRDEFPTTTCRSFLTGGAVWVGIFLDRPRSVKLEMKDSFAAESANALEV